MTEKDKIEVTKIDLTILAQASKSGDKYYFRIPPDDILNDRIKHRKWYKLFLFELPESEIKRLGLEK